MDEHHTFYFSPEIEDSLLSLLWHKPERMSDFLKECDPRVHLLQVHCQIMTEAINLTYADHGNATWANVVQTVREMGRMDEMGGLEGLNRIYSIHEPTEHSNMFIDDYIKSLKEYANNRHQATPLETFISTGGIGTLDRNKCKTKVWQPDYIGEMRVRGFKYLASLEVCKGGEFVNIRCKPLTR